MERGGGEELSPANAVMLRCLLCVKGVEEQLRCCPAALCLALKEAEI